MTNPATAIHVKKRQYIRIFQKAHALTPEQAIVPAEYGIRSGLVFHKLVKERILINANNDKYYLDPTREYKLRRRASIIIIVTLVVIVLTIFIIFAVSAIHKSV